MNDIVKLVDIQDVKIDNSNPKEQRLIKFINDIKNPYCFKCDDTVVNIEFSNSGQTLQESLSNYIKRKILTD